jgi:hypothetical protein
MKTRLGFVSNSSSASFTLVWKINAFDFDEDISVEDAVKGLLQWDSNLDDVIKATQKGEAKNTYVSRFWTCMLNTASDIGNDAMSLYFTLAMKTTSGYEIVHFSLEED